MCAYEVGKVESLWRIRFLARNFGENYEVVKNCLLKRYICEKVYWLVGEVRVKKCYENLGLCLLVSCVDSDPRPCREY